MLIDVNAYIGHWAFRQLRYNTAEALVRLMDKKKIEFAVVASINGVLYKNVHSANEELYRETKPFLDRLIPVAVLNPMYADWQEDLRICAEDLGMRGIRLFPQYHGYSLSGSKGLEIIDAASELGWPVQVPMTLVDRRQRHKWDLAEDISAAEFEKAVNLRPQTKWIILNSYGINPNNIVENANYLIDIANPYYQTLLRKEIPELIKNAGSKHVVFGTDMPFRIPDAAILKLELLNISKEEQLDISWRNAAEMFQLKLMAERK